MSLVWLFFWAGVSFFGTWALLGFVVGAITGHYEIFLAATFWMIVWVVMWQFVRQIVNKMREE